MTRRRTRIAALLTAALALTACSSVPSLSGITGRAAPQASCWLSPLTGTCAPETAPVLVVKIDDVGQARPQWNLNAADVIVVEPVEGGLTRLFAVYQSQAPETVGPIRSARITDLDLVQAFGKPGFAYSGSNSKLRDLLVNGQLQLVGAPQGGDGYSRMTDRPAPHNYAGDFATLVSRIDDPVAARLASTQYWSVSSDAAERVQDGKPAESMTAAWPASRKSFVWNNERQWWDISVYDEPLLSQLDAAGATERAHAVNIAVMETEVLQSPYRDRLGSTTPYPQTVGEGRGVVFIDGRSIYGRWKRERATDLPRWFLRDGTEIVFAPGNTWWLLVDRLENVTVSAPVQ